MPTPADARSPQVVAIWRAGRLAVLGAALIGANVASLLAATWGANRPHEVSEPWMWLFTALLATHALLGALVLLALLAAWRERREKALRPLHALPVLLAAGYAVAVLVYFGRIGWVHLCRYLA